MKENATKIDVASKVYLNFCPKCGGSIYPSRLPQELLTEYCQNCGESFETAIPRTIPDGSEVLHCKNCNIVCSRIVQNCMVCGETFHHSDIASYRVRKYELIFRKISYTFFIAFFVIPLFLAIIPTMWYLYWRLSAESPNWYWFLLSFQIIGLSFGIVDLIKTKGKSALISNIIAISVTVILYSLALAGIITANYQ